MRSRNIITIVTLTGTGGPNGGLSQAKFSNEWFKSMIDAMNEIGTHLVILSPFCEGNIKEGATEPTKSKIYGWKKITEDNWSGSKGWNYQCVPTPREVPSGWIGIYHPQNWGQGYAGQVCITDAPIRPGFTTGDYPNQEVIPEKLTELAKQVRGAGKGFIKWGQWEKPEIETDAIDAVAGAK